MADLNKEWCDALIAHFSDPDREELGPLAAEQATRLITIAARVLDPEAVEKVARLIADTTGDDFSNKYAREAHMDTASVILPYLTGEKVDG